jgi:cell division protein FtsW
MSSSPTATSAHSDAAAAVELASPAAAVATGAEGPRGADWLLTAAVVALATIGVIAAFSASYYLAVHRHNDELFFLERHLRYAGIAAVAMAAFARVPYQLWQRLSTPILLGALALLALVLAFGETRNRSTRWIFGFQPAELAKLGFIIYLARALVSRAERGVLRTFHRGMLLLIAVYGVLVVLLMKQPDMGTAAVLGVLLFGMAFVAGARVAPLVVAGLSVAGAAAAFIAQDPMRWRRVEVWLDPFGHFNGKGYQLANSVLAVATGGPFGRGLGASQQKLGFLPEAHTDFVLAILGEELGVVGISMVAALMVVVLWRGVGIAAHAQSEFGRLLAFGITLLIGTQAAVNFGVVLGLLPTKGLTLPFVSYGGTSLITMAIAVGILLNIGVGGRPDFALRWPSFAWLRRGDRPANARVERSGAHRSRRSR